MICFGHNSTLLSPCFPASAGSAALTHSLRVTLPAGCGGVSDERKANRLDRLQRNSNSGLVPSLFASQIPKKAVQKPAEHRTAVKVQE